MNYVNCIVKNCHGYVSRAGPSCSVLLQRKIVWSIRKKIHTIPVISKVTMLSIIMLLEVPFVTVEKAVDCELAPFCSATFGTTVTDYWCCTSNKTTADIVQKKVCWCTTWPMQFLLTCLCFEEIKPSRTSFEKVLLRWKNKNMIIRIWNKCEIFETIIYFLVSF